MSYLCSQRRHSPCRSRRLRHRPPTARCISGWVAGPSIPVSNLSDNHSTGYNVLASLGAHIPTTPVGVRVDGMFNQLPGKPDVGNAQIWTANANLVVSLVPGPVSPYLIGGGGYYNGDYHVFTTPGGDTDSRLVTRTRTTSVSTGAVESESALAGSGSSPKCGTTTSSRAHTTTRWSRSAPACGSAAERRRHDRRRARRPCPAGRRCRTRGRPYETAYGRPHQTLAGLGASAPSPGR